MSTPSSPFNVVNLYGSGCLRGVTVAMPTAQVQRLLPKGLELGPQSVTPPGVACHDRRMRSATRPVQPV